MTVLQRVTRPAMKALIEPFGLCEAVRAGDLLCLAGQTGIDPATHALVEGGLEAQSRQAFRNLAEVVQEAGGEPARIVQLTWYLVERADGRSFMEDALAVTAARDEILPRLVA